jgi:hypothetical protein
MMQSAYDIYESTKTQIDGLCAERVALMAQITALVAEREAHLSQIAGLVAEREAHLAQIAGLAAERDALSELNAGLRDTLTAARSTIDKWRRAYYGDIPAPTVRFDATAVSDDGPDPLEDLGGTP